MEEEEQMETGKKEGKEREPEKDWELDMGMWMEREEKKG